MNDRFLALQLFLHVARSASFSVGGREMGLSQPTTSRIISALEKKVGVALLTRTTRGVVLTEAGAEYLPRAEAILAALDEADHAARGTGELRGVLRVAMSTSTAVRCVLPRLPLFADQHPNLRIEFVLNDERQDLVGESIDVALRIGPLTDSTAVARRIGMVDRILAASPGYLSNAGAPHTPLELTGHSLIVGPAGRGAEGWTFKKGSEALSVRAGGRIVLDAADGAVAAAAAGLGIVSAGYFGLLKELGNGDLIQVLPDWEMIPAEFNVILPAARAAKPSARAFSDFVRKQLNELSDQWSQFKRPTSNRA